MLAYKSKQSKPGRPNCYVLYVGRKMLIIIVLTFATFAALLWGKTKAKVAYEIRKTKNENRGVRHTLFKGVKNTVV